MPLEELIANLNTSITALAERQQTDAQAEDERYNRFVEGVTAAVAAALAKEEPETPSRKEEYRAGALDRVQDRFDQMGYKRGDFELAAMVFDGARKMSRPINLPMPDDFKRAWIWHLERGPKMQITDELGKVTGDFDLKRAMDTGESGYGQQLVGAQYIADMWEAARNLDTLVGDIRAIPMGAPTVYIPIDGSLPEMLFVSEATSPSQSAYGTSKTPSSRRQLDAKKFTIQQVWSGELDEDSIIAFVPFLREKLNMSAAAHLGSAYYNGDNTNAATGNINLDDADPTDTKHYLAWDGIRHYWLVDTATQGYDMAGTINVEQIVRARGRLNGTDDSINTAVNNINWGTKAADLRLVCDWDTYLRLTALDEVITVDKYGPGATVITGELAKFQGIPIISPSYATKTEADGKASTTEANNTKGQITIFNPRGFIGGVRRDVQLFFDRIQRTDQLLFELYTRRAFNRFGESVAAGIYDITV